MISGRLHENLTYNLLYRFHLNPIWQRRLGKIFFLFTYKINNKLGMALRFGARRSELLLCA